MQNNYLKLDWRTAEKRAIREGVTQGLLKIGDNKRVVVVSADLAESVKVAEFKELYPERFLEVGVAEQNMAGVAAGLAHEGMIPFMASYASFSPGRNWEQIRVSIALSSANVKIIGSHGGVATGVNGPSHQATEDIALMRVLPGMTVIVPADASQCGAAIEAAYQFKGAVYIRTARPETPDFTVTCPFEIGKVYKYREGHSVTICAMGMMVWEAMMIADELEREGMSCEVLNVSTIKPLDEITILASAKKTGVVVTIEDHQISGGMGSAVTELLAEKYPVRVKRLGVNDRFGISGEWQEVYEKMGLDRNSLREAIRQFVYA